MFVAATIADVAAVAGDAAAVVFADAVCVGVGVDVSVSVVGAMVLVADLVANGSGDGGRDDGAAVFAIGDRN